MAREFSTTTNKCPKVAIIGGGPAGCFCAYVLQNKFKHLSPCAPQKLEYSPNSQFDITIFEMLSPLKTLLVTGGGRCNLAHAEYDFRELTKFYPRGEKFLYSAFSRFNTVDTVEFFHSIGVPTYTQEDGRIFPLSNSAADVRTKILTALSAKIKKEKALQINKSGNKLELITNINKYEFDHIIIAIGGHSNYNLAKSLGHTIIEPKPALIGLKTDKIFPAGVVIKNVKTKLDKNILRDDLLFTHKGISGPLAFKISSLNARKDFPYKINLQLTEEIDLQEKFNANPHKTLKNLIGEIVPKSFANAICPQENIKCSQVSAQIRNSITQNLTALELTVTGVDGGGEVVTCGGVNLNEIDPKTMQSKIIPQLSFCGEVLDIDGFCGGFNLQNCWSTAFVAAKSVHERFM